MSEKPKKIIEISGQDWMSGISAHPYMSVGGRFQQATNFDPFEKVGIFVPNKTPSRKGEGVITEDIRSFIVSVSSVAAGVFIDAFANTAKLYRIDAENGTVTDISSRLNSTSGASGSIIFKNKTVYTDSSSVRAHDYPVSAQTGNIVVLLSSLTSIVGTTRAFHIGPDRNLYMTNAQYIARITSVTGTSDNNSQYLSFESDAQTKDIDDDGQHLIIVGDSNPNADSLIGGSFRCFVAFWNMKSQDLTKIWEFKDERVYGVAAIEDEVLIFCKNNIYTCSVSSRPKVLIPLKGNSSLSTGITNQYSIAKRDNSTVVWGSGTSFRGYGRLHPSLPKTLFTAYTIPTHSGFSETYALLEILDSSGSFKLWAGTNGERLYSFDTVSSETSTTILAGIDFKQPYEFAFAKVILSEKLSSDQSVDLQILTDEGNNTILRNTNATDNSFSHTNFPGKKSHIFYPYPGAVAASTIGIFEDISDLKIINKGASIRRVEIWGRPIRQDQTVYK